MQQRPLPQQVCLVGLAFSLPSVVQGDDRSLSSGFVFLFPGGSLVGLPLYFG